MCHPLASERNLYGDRNGYHVVQRSVRDSRPQ